MSKNARRRKPAAVVIREAANKRIRQLSIESADVDAKELCVVLRFEDNTQLFIDLRSQPLFGMQYLQYVDGDLEPVKTYPMRSLRV